LDLAVVGQKVEALDQVSFVTDQGQLGGTFFDTQMVKESVNMLTEHDLTSADIPIYGIYHNLVAITTTVATRW
jgi:hypothetical protein